MLAFLKAKIKKVVDDKPILQLRKWESYYEAQGTKDWELKD